MKKTLVSSLLAGTLLFAAIPNAKAGDYNQDSSTDHAVEMITTVAVCAITAIVSVFTFQSQD